QTQTERARDEALGRLPERQSDDPAAREEARRAVAPVVEKYPQGMLLVPRGQPISERQFGVLEEEHKAYQRSLTGRDQAHRGAALFLVMSLLTILVTLYLARFQPALACSLPKITLICLLVVATLSLGLLLSKPPWFAMLIPLTVTIMVLTIAYNPQFALLMAYSLSVAMTVALDADLSQLLVQMGGLATAVLLLQQVRTRTRLVKVAAAAGLAFLAMSVATGLLSQQTWSYILADGGRNFAWAATAGFLLSGSLPLVERCFGVITEASLVELADGSHPLLQELVRRAPGTYTHSMTVATLAESAAEAIAADSLLARVGSYFHDVGKMLKPHYFIENQSGENRHESLEPALSTLIIIGHVKDGLALAEQYNLPQPVADFIRQHHGTTLVEYFYREAIRLQDEATRDASAANRDASEGASRGASTPGLAGELETSFRYPGPKPQTKEIAVVMLADATESASRALSDPTPASLAKLVRELVLKRLLDGQFEECGLTLTELHKIEESLCKSLIALYHARIKYPELKNR
ncbi:MAG TPA: HDIG domain-containing protein, partial [Pirellulaceae bacterium]|nr:HDIG domain-containing protein [Pirellulaceae bacterium]